MRKMLCSLINQNGRLKIKIDENIYEPLSFKSFRPTKKNISDFYEAGTRLFCVLSTGMESATKGVNYSNFGESWIDDYDYDFSAIDRQLALFIENAPEGYFNVMLQIDMRSWWLEKYKEYSGTYWNMSQNAADEKWRNAAAAYLQNAIKHIEEKYGDRVYAYSILGGTTTEWFSGNDCEETHPIKEEAFRRYRKDDNAKIPNKAVREKSREIAFLSPKDDDVLIDYRKFHNELMADTILFFANKVQEIILHKKLLGVYYGYILELGNARLWDYGELAYEKIFNSDDIDMIYAPAAYGWARRPEGTAAYMVTVDTLTKNNKLFFHEFDMRTHLPSLQLENASLLPGGTDGCFSEQETIDVMRREYMLAHTKGFGMWWFDMFEGWYYSDALMQEVKKQFELSKLLSGKKGDSVSEIAVFVDAESMYYVNKTSNLNGELLTWERVELAKCGAPYDMYSLCSLEEIDWENCKYKLVVFLNLFKIDEKTEQFINQNLKNNTRTLLFMYAPGYVTENSLSVENVQRMTEMRLKKLPVSENIVMYNETRFGFSSVKDFNLYVEVENDDYFSAREENVEVLGRWQGCLRPALVRKNCGDYTNVFCAGGYLTAEPLRDIAQAAGVHIYSYDVCKIVYVNANFIGIYHRDNKSAKIHVPNDGQYTDCFTGKTYTSTDGVLLIDYQEKERAQYLIKKQ